MEIKIKVPMGAKLVVDWEQNGLDDGPPLPDDLEAKIEELTSEIHLWIGATGFSSAEEAVKAMPRLNAFHAIESELSEWRSAAKKCQFDSPEELASAASLTAGQFIDGALNKEWQTATQCKTPELASARFEEYVQTVDGAAKRIGTLLDERERWREKTNCEKPEDANVRAWQLATACESPIHAEAFRSAWCTETDSMFPIAAGNKIRTLRAQRDGLDRELSVWQKATGCDTPEQAKARLDVYQLIEKTHAERMDTVLSEWKSATESKSPATARDMIHNLRTSKMWSETRFAELNSLKQDIRAWQKATGASDPANAINLSFDKDGMDRRFADVYRLQVASESEVERLKALAGIELAAWQEMTGAKDPNAAYQRFYEMETTCDKARDDVRDRDRTIKTQANTIDTANAMRAERDQDLLTAHAEIDRLRKAAQTLGLVSDDSRELAKVRAEIQTKCRETQTWKEQAERTEHARAACGVLLEKIGEALRLDQPIRWDPLPGQVAALKKNELAEKARADAELKRSIDDERLLQKTCEALGVEEWNDLPSAAEGVMKDLARKTKSAYASEEDLAAAQKDIASLITSSLRDTGIENVAHIVASYFGSFVRLDKDLDEVRKLLGANVGESVVDTAKRVMGTAIFPLPKPEKVEPGQRWAIIHDIVWTGEAGPDDAIFNGADSKIQRLDTEHLLRRNEWICVSK